MKGYALYQKGRDRPIKIALENSNGNIVYALVFTTKKAILDSVDLEYDEEIRKVNIRSESDERM